MKRRLSKEVWFLMAAAAGLVLLLVLFAGCSGITCSAEYSGLIDRTAAVSNETATRAEAGQLSPAEQTQALRAQATIWQRIKAAKDGRAD